jgi:hypothetical protein
MVVPRLNTSAPRKVGRFRFLPTYPVLVAGFFLPAPEREMFAERTEKSTALRLQG